ncbi:uncharacterized protein LOC131935158 [Physella acuta]|uniref:uncharacterized protein LOC131935158 n=1 Tax=Physella acuta TaxID=109671 RepID=UPI0027DB4720|nr:uncharacterized protein LOC131935158 [Physella acuta]XP_059147500.1 uncharacterized protein LOC131935158 [Physella acuta]XP_059147501.1 uncharacterized protein LOC131935158 [Physella acuta]XP_059147502.1 uncharacterized protein LOC131935158 [Physella acuta]XP_059147504.1 uncharacterized protein LOC131935158 [Physella acuta]XP_059147505.1 uncharacterized protein LOC131935158 [Physella acuta]
MWATHWWEAWLLVIVLIASGVSKVQGNGRLMEPPSRASMWRVGFNTPPDFNDHALSCGGLKVQHEENGGKCGVCGDPWQGPKEHEPGGKYATGAISRRYSTSETIRAVVQLTTNYNGWFEFRLCPSDDPLDQKTQECLDQYLLNDTNGRSRFPVPSSPHMKINNIQHNLVIPQGVFCKACLLQWKYNTAQNMGTPDDGKQEEYYGCADIAIGYDDIEIGVTQKPQEEEIASTARPPAESWNMGIEHFNATVKRCQCVCTTKRLFLSRSGGPRLVTVAALVALHFLFACVWLECNL